MSKPVDREQLGRNSRAVGRRHILISLNRHGDQALIKTVSFVCTSLSVCISSNFNSQTVGAGWANPTSTFNELFYSFSNKNLLSVGVEKC